MNKQKGLAPILIVLLIALAVGGYLLYQKQVKPVPQPITQPSPNPTTSDETVDTEASRSATWKTYTNENNLSKKDNETSLPKEVISYKVNPTWSTYTDNKARFTIQYHPKNKVSDQSKEGEAVSILNCGSVGPTGKEICTLSYRISIYNDYDQGSRREWVNKKFAPYKPYYLDWIIDGRKALVVIEGNPGGSSGILVAIPNGFQMVVYGTGFVSWDPDTNKLPDLTSHKNILSTFRFDSLP